MVALWIERLLFIVLGVTVRSSSAAVFFEVEDPPEKIRALFLRRRKKTLYFSAGEIKPFISPAARRK